MVHYYTCSKCDIKICGSCADDIVTLKNMIRYLIDTVRAHTDDVCHISIRDEVKAAFKSCGFRPGQDQEAEVVKLLEHQKLDHKALDLLLDKLHPEPQSQLQTAAGHSGVFRIGRGRSSSPPAEGRGSSASPLAA